MEIKVIKDILGANDQLAVRNQELLNYNKIFAVNLMSSPGAGKTSLILETIKHLNKKINIGVIEGDVSSNIDAETIGKKNIPVVQINTGGGCHLDANMINTALNNLPLPQIKLIFIENVGNLICTADFTLGEHKKVLLASITEGDDKPFKYPLMFHKADAVLLNKLDLLPYVKFNMESFSRAVKTINNKVEIILLSCTTGQGIENWINWLLTEIGQN
jgi:hydrogenase nickel incorporation protein HypB